jgi:hypothetical protein
LLGALGGSLSTEAGFEAVAVAAVWAAAGTMAAIKRRGKASFIGILGRSLRTANN